MSRTSAPSSLSRQEGPSRSRSIMPTAVSAAIASRSPSMATDQPTSTQQFKEHEQQHVQSSSNSDRAPLYARTVSNPLEQQQAYSSSSSSADAAGGTITGAPHNQQVSNAVDIDQARVTSKRSNTSSSSSNSSSSSSSSRPVTYHEATAGDYPTSALGVKSSSSSSSSGHNLNSYSSASPQQQQQQQQQGMASNEVAIDDINFTNFVQHEQINQQQQQSSRSLIPSAAKQQQQPLSRHLGRPVGGGMPDFPSGQLDLVKQLNLDGIFLERRASVTHDVDGPDHHLLQQQQQQQQQQRGPETLTAALPTPASTRHASSRSSSSRKHKQQQQQQQQQPKLKYSEPRPHPLYLKPQHVKTHFKTTTSDGWKLHLIRTQVLNVPPRQHHPVILCPGLGSSGAYSFDLSPNVSLADYLAGKGWDVWTCELRGNGMSDKPKLFSRSRWWTIDDYVEKDVPTIIRFVLKETHSQQVHFLGHSMGGMILCGVMARVDTTTAKIRSCIAVGSGLFLEDSWWRLFERFKFASHALWIMPSGTLLRNYARLMFGPWAIPYIDMLYFWPTNVDPQVGRAMMRRNFSNISVGVIQQISSAFQPKGLLSADKKMVYADPVRLSKVSAPALFMVGDRDRMCPAEGARKTWQMFGCAQKRFVCLGPAAGFSDHYGHFDILMGKRVEREVFPILHNFLLQHDAPMPRPRL